MTVKGYGVLVVWNYYSDGCTFCEYILKTIKLYALKVNCMVCNYISTKDKSVFASDLLCGRTVASAHVF